MTDRAASSFLAGVSLFSRLDPEELADVSRLLRPVTLSTGETLFHQGSPGTTLWVLGPSTEVLVSRSEGPGARGAPIVTLRAGQTVGEMALVDEGLRSGTATVTRGGLGYVMDAVELHLWRDAGRPAAFKVLRQMAVDLCARLRGTSDRIVARGESHPPSPTLIPDTRPSADELDDFPSFRDLPAVVKVALAEKLRRLDIDQVAPLFAEGDLGDAAYFLVDGEVDVGRNGRTLARLKAGELFGMVSVLDGGLRSASCVTTGPARLWRLSAEDFELLFTSGNRFALHIVDIVARQLVSHLRAANLLLAPRGSRGNPGPEAEMLPRGVQGL